MSGEVQQLFGGKGFQKGQSGNPGGRYVTRAVRRANELYDALLAELGGAEALSLMDRTLQPKPVR